MSDLPLLSVVIPVFNGERYLADALASVRNQAAAGIEIIVVDDGSTDASAQISQRTQGVTYVYQANAGPAAARNRGIGIAHAPLIAFIDADDLWTADKLAMQLPLLEQGSAADVVTGHTQCVRLNDAQWENLEGPRFLPMLGATIVRRTVFERIGGFDESLRVAEDVDWFVRLRAAGIEPVVLPQIVLHYRLHGANLTRDWKPQQVGYAHVLKKLLDQRRSKQ